MNSDTNTKPLEVKSAPSRKYLFLRYIYPFLLIIGAVFRIIGIGFVDKNLETAVLIVYYAFGTLSILTLFLYKIEIPEITLMLLYPILMALSPVPYETGLLILMMIAIIKQYKYQYKTLLICYFVLCILVGFIAICLSVIVFSSVKDTVLSSQYSENGKYRIDVTQGWFDGKYIELYQIYGNTFQTFNRTLEIVDEYSDPTVEWVDNDNLKIDDTVINIHSSDTCN